MPSITVFTNPLTPGIAQVPVFTAGDPSTWELIFNDGQAQYVPANVSMRVGYVNGLDDGAYANAFWWWDRMNNRSIGSFVVASAVPSGLAWDIAPASVIGGNGVWLIRGQIPPNSGIRRVYVIDPGDAYGSAPTVGFVGGGGSGATATAILNSGAVGPIALTANDVYSTAPTVTISGGSGIGAQATASINANGVSAVYLLNPGVDYPSGTGPLVFSGGGGSGAAGFWISEDVTSIYGTHTRLRSVQVTNAGTGYTSAPTVTIGSPGSGTGASVLATVNNNSNAGQVSGITVGTPGTGSLNGATISITGGGGSGAAATAILTRGQLNNIDVVAVNYPAPLAAIALTIAGGGGVYGAAQFSATLAGDGLSIASYQVALTDAGLNYISPPTVTGLTTPAPGVGFTMEVDTNSSGTIIASRITAGGTGYLAAWYVMNQSGVKGLAKCVTAGGAITDISFLSQTAPLTPSTTLSFGVYNGTITSLTAYVTASGGIAQAVITNGGSNYASAPTATISSGTGTLSTGVVDGRVSALTVIARGTGYPASSTFALVFTGGSGTGATGTASSDAAGTIVSAIITNAGTGFLSQPTMGVTSGSGGGVVIRANINDNQNGGNITALTVINGGSGYSSAPTVSFSSGSASAVVGLVPAGGIVSITVTAPGSGYTSLPSVTFTPNKGTTAIPSGIETNGTPFISNQNLVPVLTGVAAVPFTRGRRTTSQTLVYDDTLLVVRPRVMVNAVLTEGDESWSGTMNPVSSFVASMLTFRRCCVVDLEIFGDGRLLYSGALTILAP